MRPNQEGRKAPLRRRRRRIAKMRQRRGGLIWSTPRASLLDPWSASDAACDALASRRAILLATGQGETSQPPPVIRIGSEPWGRRLWLACLAVPLLLATAPGTVRAQDDTSNVGKPLTLAPPRELKAKESAPALAPPPVVPGSAVRPRVLGPRPLQARPLTSSPAQGPVSPASPVAKAEPGIRVGNLDRIDPDAAGVLNRAQGGFGTDMWSGTRRAVVEALLPRLPVNATSPAMRGLMRRLLLSEAAVPEGEAGKTRLITLRIDRLGAMGDLVGVNDLLNATPGHGDDEALTRIEADARFLTNDNARACALATSQISSRQSNYWQKSFIFCQALAGQNGPAALGVALLRETGEQDPIFFALVDAVAAGGGVTIDSMPDPSPLHLAMARVAKAQLPADVIESNNPGTLRTIAVSPNAPVELRLEAAERAEAAGALPVDDLRQLYTSVPFSAEDLANPFSKAEAEAGALSRALLYRTALVQTVPTAQAEAVTLALHLAREGGRYVSTVRAFMPVLKRIPASAELAWFALEAVRALLATGEHEAARAWFTLLRNKAAFDEASALALVSLMPLARLVGSEEAGDWSGERLTAWWEAERGRDGAATRAARLYTLLEALGEPVSGDLWEALLTGSQRATVVMPRPALWFRLEEAARQARKGETVLLSLLALGDGGPAQADPVVLGRVLGALGAVGLEGPARALAVEAAVAAGL